MLRNHRQTCIRAAAKFVNEKIKKPLKVAEIGVANGRNAVFMLKEMNIERLYLVDPYRDYKDGPLKKKGEAQKNCYKEMFLGIQAYLPKVVLVTKDSIFAASLFKDEYFDFVYIDGCHRYPSVKKDLEAWWPKIAKGGVLGGHDFGQVYFPGVARAVEDFSGKTGKKFRLVGGLDWVIMKPFS